MTPETDPLLFVLLVASNLAIAIACLAIPAAMARIALRARRVPFPLIGWLFAGFLLVSSARHFCAALIYFRPAWHLLAVVSCFAAIITSATAVLLWAWRRRIAAALEDFQRFADTIRQAAK